MPVWGEPWISHKRRGLRAAVTMLLGRAPMTGAEIMDAVERMSGGWWRPSPGSVYPLLEEMGHEGVVQRKPDGRYELSPSVRERYSRAWGSFHGGGPRTVRDAVAELAALLSYLEDVRRTKAEEFREARGPMKEIRDRLDRLMERER